MCPQSRREGHAHATAVADTSVQSWIVVVNLQYIEARSVANGNTSAKRGEFNSWKNAGSFLAKRIQKCPWESSLVEKWKVPTKPPVNFPNENNKSWARWTKQIAGEAPWKTPTITSSLKSTGSIVLRDPRQQRTIHGGISWFWYIYIFDLNIYWGNKGLNIKTKK